MKTAASPQPMRLTRQRRLVLDILRESGGHLDAETLYRRARARRAKISLATVYRSLAHLRRANLIRENRLGENHAHFEPAGKTLHFHFTCGKCGRVVEFESPQVVRAVNAFGGREHLDILDVRLELRGYCADCRPE